MREGHEKCSWARVARKGFEGISIRRSVGEDC